MSELICPLCNEIIKTGHVRKEWWMSDIDKRVAHGCCITAYEKGITKGKTAVNADLEFAYKQTKVLTDLLEIPVHESAEVTGTILGLVRGSVERLMNQVIQLQHDLEKRRDNAEDEESSRWCERLEWLHTEYGADSSGCDSGDPLDCVEVEIRQAIVNAQKKIAGEICSYLLFTASPVLSPNGLVAEITKHYDLEI